MDKPYSNRELDLKFDSLHEKLDVVIEQNKKLDSKVAYTNGKVRKHTLALVAVAALAVGMGLNNAPLILSFFGL